jgi:hypothetical protein
VSRAARHIGQGALCVLAASVLWGTTSTAATSALAERVSDQHRLSVRWMLGAVLGLAGMAGAGLGRP